MKAFQTFRELSDDWAIKCWLMGEKARDEEGEEGISVVMGSWISLIFVSRRSAIENSGFDWGGGAENEVMVEIKLVSKAEFSIYIQLLILSICLKL